MNLEKYLKKYKSLKVTHLIRTCEPTYDEIFFENNGIKCHVFYLIILLGFRI